VPHATTTALGTGLQEPVQSASSWTVPSPDDAARIGIDDRLRLLVDLLREVLVAPSAP